MTISPFATSAYLTDKRYDREGSEITRITIHHMAGVASGADCALYFCNNGLENSANYCIGVDGDISCNVIEEYGSWTSNSGNSDKKRSALSFQTMMIHTLIARKKP